MFSRREFFADEDEEMAKRLITMVAMTESVQFVLSVKLSNNTNAPRIGALS